MAGLKNGACSALQMLAEPFGLTVTTTLVAISYGKT